MKIYSVNDPEFCSFGKVLKIDASELIAAAEKIAMPESGSAYVLSLPELEELDAAKEAALKYFGGITTQTGYCYGKSNRMDALEWHKSSEINIAVTDMLLLLGKVWDIDEDGRYDSAKVMAFKVPKGTAIEVYATTMHFCPINTNEGGFGCIVMLPAGTNAPLEQKSPDKLLFKTNKWLIAHEDNAELIKKGVHPGIYGENYSFPQNVE